MESRLKLWLEHPITQCYMRLLREHREAHLKAFLNCGALTPDKVPELSQIKGQINTLDLMLDIDSLENFFEGEINREDV